MADGKPTDNTSPAAASPAAENPKSSETKAEKKAADAEFKASKTVHVKLYSPYQVYFDDDAESISAENDTGPFDVLPGHHNFISLLNPCDVVIKAEKAGDKTIKISRGVIHVRRNIVTIFLDV